MIVVLLTVIDNEKSISQFQNDLLKTFETSVLPK